MSDFTKEELRNIKDALEAYEWPIRGLEGKIQSMIDSYCEHKDREFLGDVFCYECKKCQKIFIDEEEDYCG